MHTVLRLPENAMRNSVFCNLSEFGGPKITSLGATCSAALLRAALQTVSTWPKWLEQLEKASKSSLPLGLACRGSLSPAHWESTPIAANLAHAAAGFPGDDRWSAGAQGLCYVPQPVWYLFLSSP